MIGKTISHYKILSKLGEGGMGTVYKAQDNKLDRFVALKFLPQHLSQDEENKKRFIHEAKAASALDHPNICTIFEIDEASDGQMFIAMAYYEGVSLKDKIEQGPLKLDEASDIATQMADGLARAHAKKIIHRDIKPANIIITEKNQAKIVDFGLAKLAGRTMLTKEGMTLGTTAYMSPEQTQGTEVDDRTDIWALGAVLYEMISGKQPFAGDYEQAVMYSIMNEDPEPLTTLRTGVPMDLEKIVNKCLAKGPRERYQHISEIPVDLKAIAFISPNAPKTVKSTVSSKAKPGNRLLPWGIAVVMTVVATFFAIRGFLGSNIEAPTSLTRFTITLSPGQRLIGTTSVAISPDGQRLAYSAATGDEPSRLYLRELGEYAASPIPGTEGGDSPFFSPDGQWLGFFTEKKLMKIAIAGGTPVTIYEVASLSNAFRSASWGMDGSIIFPVGFADGLARVDAGGGKAEMLITPDVEKGELGYHRPHILPGGKAVLFGLWTSNGARLGVLSLTTGKRYFFTVGTEASISLGGGHYVPTGHVVYVQSGGLMAIPFDLARLEASGSPMPLTENINISSTSTTATRGSFAISETGTLVLVAVYPVENKLVWVDRQGLTSPAVKESGIYVHPRLSANGKSVAVSSISEKGSDVMVYDLERGARTRLTVEGSINNFHAWLADGSQITFNSTRVEGGIYWKPADGSGQAEMLLGRKYPRLPGSWTRDGKFLAFTEVNPKSGKDIWIFNSDSSIASPILASPFQEHSPVFSPDGRWLLYVSDESGREEVYATRYPGLGEKKSISTSGGREPVWSRDGQEIFYRNGDQIIAVPVQLSLAFTIGKPRVLFAGKWATNAITNANYDVSADGQRFLMVEVEESATAPELRVVVNWFEELNRHANGAK
jgi:serine/threonine protein kinase